jgi:hypothetical protein
MVISVHTKSRASFNDLATLKVNHVKGSVETPNRIINRHDLNAKDEIGADIPLTRTSKSFIIQEIIDRRKLEHILTTNGYLAQMDSKLSRLTHRVDNSKALVLLYPSLTSEAVQILNSSSMAFDFIRFVCELGREMSLEAVLLPIFNDLFEILADTKKRNLQLIPVLNFKIRYSDFQKTI